MSTKTTGMSLDEYLARKLRPVRVAVNLLVRELQMSGGNSVALPKDYLNDLISTMELFVEDYERASTIKDRNSSGTRPMQPVATQASAAVKLA
jgi:hypothetical protein